MLRIVTMAWLMCLYVRGTNLFVGHPPNIKLGNSHDGVAEIERIEARLYVNHEQAHTWRSTPTIHQYVWKLFCVVDNEETLVADFFVVTDPKTRKRLAVFLVCKYVLVVCEIVLCCL